MAQIFTLYFQMIVKDIAIRDCFQVSRLTHRYLIESISESMHPMVFLSSRLVNFDKSLTICSKSAFRLLVKIKQTDCQTVHGKNLMKIAKKCKVNEVDQLSSSIVKANM